MDLRKHKTKIVCTIGPSSSDPEVMRAMIRAGMDVARLNFSHGGTADHALLIERLRAAAEVEGRPLAVMADLPGPKIRLGDLDEGAARLVEGQLVCLTAARGSGGCVGLPVVLDRLADRVSPGDVVFLKDGLVQLRVREVDGEEVLAVVTVGGEVRSRAGVNLPGVDVGVRALTDRDREWLAFAVEQGVDAVALSFVAGPDDVHDLRRAAAGLGARPFVVAKVERALALRNIDGILDAADAVMVARGDLGVETSLEGIALVQKQLIARAVARGRPVITATQMLESMVGNPRPTRAEATDVANAILDGTDCVMLSGESAVGAYPVEAVRALAGIAAATEARRGEVAGFRLDPGSGTSVGSVSADGAAAATDGDAGAGDAAGEGATPGGGASPGVPPRVPTLVDLIALGVRDVAERRAPVAVFVPTRSGATARNVARFRLHAWVIAVSPLAATCRSLQFSYGVWGVLEERPVEDWGSYARSWLRAEGVTPGLVILTAGPSEEHPEGNHRMELIEL